jgi:hypothetical protein
MNTSLSKALNMIFVLLVELGEWKSYLVAATITIHLLMIVRQPKMKTQNLKGARVGLRVCEKKKKEEKGVNHTLEEAN